MCVPRNSPAGPGALGPSVLLAGLLALSACGPPPPGAGGGAGGMAATAPDVTLPLADGSG